MNGSGPKTSSGVLNNEIRYKSSGKLLLCLCELTRDKHTSGYGWGTKYTKVLKKIKMNIIQDRSFHLVLTGDYYAFRNRANYGLINHSSITQFFTTGVSRRYTII